MILAKFLKNTWSLILVKLQALIYNFTKNWIFAPTFQVYFSNFPLDICNKIN